MQARARDALLQVQLAEADALSLENPKKQKKVLLARRALITEADQQRSAIVALGEPEYALDALLRIGDSALLLYRDVLSAPAPKGVAGDPETEALYRSMVATEGERFRAVAFQYYDAGALLADRVSWQGKSAEQLRQKRDAVKKQIVELSTKSRVLLRLDLAQHTQPALTLAKRAGEARVFAAHDHHLAAVGQVLDADLLDVLEGQTRADPVFDAHHRALHQRAGPLPVAQRRLVVPGVRGLAWW